MRARWESSLELERESRIETGAAHGTAEVSEKKKILQKANTCWLPFRSPRRVGKAEHPLKSMTSSRSGAGALPATRQARSNGL